jgi:hypothetical protein
MRIEWSKSDCFDPVLCGDSLHLLVSLAVKNIALCIKVIAEMPFVKAFSHLMSLP